PGTDKSRDGHLSARSEPPNESKRLLFCGLIRSRRRRPNSRATPREAQTGRRRAHSSRRSTSHRTASSSTCTRRDSAGAERAQTDPRHSGSTPLANVDRGATAGLRSSEEKSGGHRSTSARRVSKYFLFTFDARVDLSLATSLELR